MHDKCMETFHLTGQTLFFYGIEFYINNFIPIVLQVGKNGIDLCNDILLPLPGNRGRFYYLVKYTLFGY